jgi:hypothetical protein
VKVESNLPPGFLLEKHPNGELGLNVGMLVVTNVKVEGKIMHYLKFVLPSSVTPKQIKKRTWEVYMTLKSEDSCV